MNKKPDLLIPKFPCKTSDAALSFLSSLIRKLSSPPLPPPIIVFFSCFNFSGPVQVHVGRVPERRYHRSPSPQTGFCRPLHRINSRRGIHDQGRNTHNFSGHRQEVPRSGKVSLVKLHGKILIIDTSGFPYGCKKGQSATIFLLNRAPCNDVAFCFLVEK